MVISRIIAFVYGPVKPCCFNSQVSIYLDDFQLSKTVFILARFWISGRFRQFYFLQKTRIKKMKTA